MIIKRVDKINLLCEMKFSEHLILIIRHTLMRTIIFISMLCFCCSIYAQEDGTENSVQNTLIQKYENAKEKLDALIDKHQRITTDTNYVNRPNTPWTIRLKTDIFGNNIGFKRSITEIYDLHTICKSTIGVSANYRGISLALTFNPMKMFAKSSDIEYNINYYSNRFGADLQASRVTSFRQTIGTQKVSVNGANMEGLSVNAYYVFNNRRFSYPAAFSQSWIQHKSAGSFLASITGYAQRMDTGNAPQLPTDNGTPLSRIELAFAAIGAGYAYNFVPRGDHWLLHISTVPSITVWKSSKVFFRDMETTTVHRPFNFYMTGRVGATYSWKKYFVGITGLVQLYEPGKVNDINIELLKFKGRGYIGIRL